MKIEKIKRQTLIAWVNKLEKLLETEEDEHNIELYNKWLNEAREEIHFRDLRKANYLRYKYGK